MTGKRLTGDQGSSLIELLVVMVIFSGLMGLVYGVLGQVQAQTASTQRRADSVDQARMALAQMDRQIRSGNVLYDPAAESALLPLSMRVYTQANGEQRCVQWQVQQPQAVLRTRSWSSNGISYSNLSPWQIVARGVVNDSTQKPFQLDPGALYGSRLLNIRLLVQTPRDGGRAPVEVQTSLSGRNTHYGYDPNSCNPLPPA